MELTKITENVYYIPGSVNVGVVKDGNDSAILIDTGLDDDYGKKIIRLLEENNLRIKAVVNTHSHADHCGGNKTIKEKTGATIYAPELESGIIMYPFLEPLYLFSGASPLDELKNKFLMARASDVDYIIRSDERTIGFDNIKLSIISLPGHSPNQIGIETDGVLFCADALFSEEVLNKHKIPFYADIDKAKESLRLLKGFGCNHYVLSHGGLESQHESFDKLVGINLNVIDQIEEHILNTFHGKKTTENALKTLCNDYHIDLNNVQSYYLMNTVIMAYLSSLYKKRKMNLSMENNELLWEKI